MTRSSRLDPIGGWHHVMSRGVNRSTIFTCTEDRLAFGRLLARTVERFEIEIHAYCLMGNHFHLLVRCPDGGLSSSMHHLLSNYARIVNDTTGRVGHLFGDRFCSRLITDVDYLANVVRYIHLNPLDISGVSDIGAYRWSSHRTYLGRRRCPSWLSTETVLGWFPHTQAFDGFVRSGHGDATSPVRADPDSLLEAIDITLVERSDASHRHVPAQRRAVALLLTESLTSACAHDVIERLGIESDGARRTAFSRARALRSQEPVIDDVAELTRQMFLRRGVGSVETRSA